MTDYDPQHGDHVRIVSTGPTPGESICEGTVDRPYPDLPGFELHGRSVTSGKDIRSFFATDEYVRRGNGSRGFAQTTTLIRKAQP